MKIAWFFVGALVVMALSMLLARVGCVNDGEVMGIEVEWRAVGGCYYKTQDGFVSKEVFRYRIDQNPDGAIIEEQGI